MGGSGPSDTSLMKLALRLARRGYGRTSPNPMVGSVIVRKGRIIGRGWHHGAGQPHAEVEAIKDARQHGFNPRGATLYVTLEPCCTHGRTPPCTEAILAAGIGRVVVAAADPNPAHAGRGFNILRSAGVEVAVGVLAGESAALNAAFNHWIVHRTPWVVVKAAMTLDGKIATRIGESKWITGLSARATAMFLRQGVDAILAGVNTVLSDDPSLTCRPARPTAIKQPALRRLVLDSRGRTPLHSRVVADEFASLTTVVVTDQIPRPRLRALERKVAVWMAPARDGRVDLPWLLARLGQESVTSLLVEGGGQLLSAFLMAGLAHRLAFFYAPKIIGGRAAFPAVAGRGAGDWREVVRLKNPVWKSLGEDLWLTAGLEMSE